MKPSVDINRIAGLDTVEITSDGVHIGALVRHAQLERQDGAFVQLSLLRQALVNLGIRRLAVSGIKDDHPNPLVKEVT